MKVLTSLNILILIFTSCTSAKYQQMQDERNRRRAAYEDARRKNDWQTLKDTFERDVLGTWQFLDIEVLESDLSNEIQTAAVALAASSRKHLTIRFFHENHIHFYELNNGNINASGEFTIRIERIAETLVPLLKLDRYKSLAPEEVIFSHPRLRRTLIAIEQDRLYLTTGYGQLLTPAGWAQIGGSRYSFKRVK